MNLTNHTILITGGSSGLGLELATRLLQQNNKALICGRSEQKLAQAKEQYPKLEVFQCNLSVLEECERLYDWVKTNHPTCNILVNNAAIAHSIDFASADDSISFATQEFQTNVLAPIALTKLFLPLITSNSSPTVINVTTGLVYSPRVIYPFYNATKAALHSFTQVLRAQLQSSGINVIEVLYPAVDTPWHKGNAPKIAISAKQAVQEVLKKLNSGQNEIRVGKVGLLYYLSRLSPNLAAKVINRV